MNKIDELMLSQGKEVIKPDFAVIKSKLSLDAFNIDPKSEFYIFFSKYFTYGLIKRRYAEALVEVARENDFWDLNHTVRIKWNISNSYILCSEDTYHGGYLYNTENCSVWDFTLGEQEFLGTNKMRHWNSFYEFLEWYLNPNE